MSFIIVQNNWLYYNKKFVDNDYRGGLIMDQSVDSNFGISKGRILWRKYPEMNDVNRVESFVKTGRVPRPKKSEESLWLDALLFLNGRTYLVEPRFAVPLETNDTTICLGGNHSETEQLRAILMAGLGPVTAIEEMFRLKGIDYSCEIVSTPIADFIKEA